MLPSRSISSSATCSVASRIAGDEGKLPMLAVSRFVLRHKLAVVALWILVLAAGVFASAHLSGRLSGQFALPSAPSYQANQRILRPYGNGGDGYPEVAQVTLPPGGVA